MSGNKIKGPEIFLLISFGLVGIVAVLYLWLPSFAQSLGQATNWLQNFALEQGYWGAFVVTAISNAALIIPIPYGTILFLLGSLGLNPWFLGLIAGLAAALGEVVAYYVGRGAGLLASSEHQENFRRINVLITRHPRLVPWLIFFFGTMPIPDDIILIPLGMIKYPFWKTIIPDALGKLVMTTAMSLAGKYSFTAIQGLFGSEGGLWSGVIIFVLTILMIYFTIKVKWGRLIK